MKVELASNQWMDESEGLYGQLSSRLEGLLVIPIVLLHPIEQIAFCLRKLLSTSPSWCGHIPWLVQFVVPPCWFGKPQKEERGPDGKPSWCKDVFPGAKQYIEDCAPPLGAAPPQVPLGAAPPKGPGAKTEEREVMEMDVSSILRRMSCLVCFCLGVVRIHILYCNPYLFYLK